MAVLGHTRTNPKAKYPPPVVTSGGMHIDQGVYVFTQVGRLDVLEPT